MAVVSGSRWLMVEMTCALISLPFISDMQAFPRTKTVPLRRTLGIEFDLEEV